MMGAFPLPMYSYYATDSTVYNSNQKIIFKKMELWFTVAKRSETYVLTARVYILLSTLANRDIDVNVCHCLGGLT